MQNYEKYFFCHSAVYLYVFSSTKTRDDVIEFEFGA